MRPIKYTPYSIHQTSSVWTGFDKVCCVICSMLLGWILALGYFEGVDFYQCNVVTVDWSGVTFGNNNWRR